MMKEIGSEFWIDSIPTVLPEQLNKPFDIGNDQCLLLSGRTAIDYVLKDIEKPVHSVYMPSYCCYSMIQPFMDRHIHIYYYDVICDDRGFSYNIDYNNPCDIFFATSYFGFTSTVMDFAIEAFSNKGILIIEDITHRLFTEKMCSDKADYSIASLRKWMAIPSGGLAIKHKGRFKKQELKPAPQFIEYKVTAMKRKADYLFRNKGSKNAFLDMFTMFSDQLQSNYKSFEIDSLSKILLSNIDIHILKEKRRENASYLYEELKNCDFIKPIIKEPDFANDCPLYLPIKVETKFRNDLRDYLIAKRIYCPIHWPIPNINCLNKATKRIYEEELSLVCDQRYGIDDMRRIVKTIGEFWRRLC